ncbi:MAG: hypothetical protein COA40_03400 [Aequorivita sp.]|nr:MAG: hypothetical protein COA40_03400 [Aequorivita sp.]
MQIYNHDSQESIVLKNNLIELNNWITHLGYIFSEIDNLLNLSQVELSNKLEQQPVVAKLSIKREENNIILKNFRKYKDGLPKAMECDDMDCDMFYVNEHEKFRKIYMAHVEKYRKIKEEYFNLLRR